MLSDPRPGSIAELSLHQIHTAEVVLAVSAVWIPSNPSPSGVVATPPVEVSLRHNRGESDSATLCKQGCPSISIFGYPG